MPRVTGVLLPWTMPPFINGYLATNGSWMAVLVQVVCLLVSMAIYYPFFKIMDNQNLKQEQALAEKAS
jgi:PTS system cellobiose-specific IIC component